jgi:hypothetical protein
LVCLRSSCCLCISNIPFGNAFSSYLSSPSNRGTCDSTIVVSFSYKDKRYLPAIELTALVSLSIPP